MAMAVASVSAPREKGVAGESPASRALSHQRGRRPGDRGLVASHLGTRVAFFITAACARWP